MITRDEWLAALEAARPQPQHDPDVLTLIELAELLGVSRETARRKVNSLLAAGRVTTTTKAVLMTNGALRMATAYRLKK